VGVAQIEDNQINTLRLKGRGIFYHLVLQDVIIVTGRRLGWLACDLHELMAATQQWLPGLAFVSKRLSIFLQPSPVVINALIDPKILLRELSKHITLLLPIY
jgi:hypothetical protein